MIIIKILALILLLASIRSQSTYQIQLSASTTGLSMIPTYYLGLIPANSELTFEVKINTATSAATDVAVSVRDATNTNDISGVLALVAGTDSSTLRVTWTSGATAAGYYIRVLTAGSSTTFLHLFTISVYIKVGTSQSTIFQNFVDLTRSNAIKYFYVRQLKTINIVYNSSTAATTVALKAIDTTVTNNMKIGATITVSATSSSVNGAITYSFVVAKGFYFVQLTLVAASTGVVAIPTDPYTCPNPAGTTDLYFTFVGCSPASLATPSTFPCFSFVSTNVCGVCFLGYKLVNGVCTYNPCGSRQYFANSICNAVSPTCLTFDNFTGACTSCVSQSLVVLNGVCSLLSCPAGFSRVGNTCKNDYCRDVVPITGQCLSCISSAFNLINKMCYPISCFFFRYYFSSTALNCIPFPSNCATINYVTETCQTCLSTHQLVNNTCRPICNSTQYPVNGTCYNLPFRCLELNIFLQCSLCEPGYVVVSGACSLFTTTSNIPSGSSSSSGSSSGSSSSSTSGSSSGSSSSSSSSQGIVAVNKLRYCILFDNQANSCIKCMRDRIIVDGVCQN